MTSDRLRLLVNELRRGEFIQGARCLRRPGHHCALGVACEVYRRHTSRGRWAYYAGRFAFLPSDEPMGRPNGGWSMPSGEVIEWYLDDDPDPTNKRALETLFESVAMRNDRRNSFEELARMIEAFIARDEGEVLAAVG
jgi:hypothetical protein